MNTASLLPCSISQSSHKDPPRLEGGNTEPPAPFCGRNVMVSLEEKHCGAGTYCGHLWKIQSVTGRELLFFVINFRVLSHYLNSVCVSFL